MREEGPRHAREEGADHEGGHLVARGGHAQRLRGDLVLADGEERAPMEGLHEVPDHDIGDPRPPEHPREVRPLRHPRESARAAHRVDVQDRDADDLAEPQRHDGQVVAAQPHRGQTDQESGHGGGQPADKDRDQERQARDPPVRGVARPEEERHRVDGIRGGGIRPHGHESRVSDGELPRDPVHEVQAQGEDDVDGAEDQHAVDVGVQAQALRGPVDPRHDRDRRHEGGQPAERRHTFSATFRPRRPAGLIRRTMIRITNAIASR